MTLKIIKEYALITLGVALVAIGVALFYSPNGIVGGGVSGLSIIVYELSGRYMGASIPLWVTNFSLNLPIFVVAIKRFGMVTMAKTIYATAMLTFMFFLTSFVPEGVAPDDMVLVVIYGGVICGVGMFFVFRCNATTGGTATFASLINAKVRHVSLARIMFMLDVAIMGIGLLTFDAERTMYAVITVFVTVKVIDTLLEGLDFAKSVFIITNKGNEISEHLLAELDRGVTKIAAQGMYSKEERDVLVCVVSNKQIVMLKDIVHKADPAAFMSITNVREVLGKGFKLSG